MKVLFVCRQNVGRSQMAMSIFNKYIAGVHADSRGTIVQTEGLTLEDFGAKNTLRVLQDEESIDGRQLKSLQLKESDLKDYDTIIVMSEPENTPQWLERSTKAERWNIMDTKTSDYETTVEVFRELKQRVLSRFK